MEGISPELNYRLQEVMVRCGPLDSNRALRDNFVDARLARWRHQLPDADNPSARATALIAFLRYKFTAQRQNALVLFLRLLADGTDPGDACHQELDDLATALEAELARPTVNIEAELERLLPPGEERRRAQEQISQFRHYNELLREWKELHQHLDTLSNLTFGQYAAQLRRFENTPIDMPTLKASWKPVELSIHRILEWAKSINYIGAPYRISGDVKQGAEWAIKLSEAVVVVDEHFYAAPGTKEDGGAQRSPWPRFLGRDRDSENVWRDWWWPRLVDLSDQLENYLRTYMSMADDNLRTTAADLYDLSQRALWREGV